MKFKADTKIEEEMKKKEGREPHEKQDNYSNTFKVKHTDCKICRKNQREIFKIQNQANK